MNLKPQWKTFLLHKYAHWTLCWHWRWSWAKPPNTSVTPLLWITSNQLGLDERTQGINPLRACESPSRKALERVRTFYSLINRSLRIGCRIKTSWGLKTFGNLKNWITLLRKFPGEKERERKEDFFIRSQAATFLLGQNSAEIDLMVISPCYLSLDAEL